MQKNKKRNWIEYLTVGIAIILSVGSYLWSLKNGYATIYNDAMAHLNISRLVIDNIQPGLAQLGSVWLPLNHILDLTLIWNNWAWHSGFAGSIFSMIAYIASAWVMYKIIFIVTENKWAGFIGAVVFASNPNMLYLQTTPLTEPLYILFFVLSILLFLKWIKTNELNYLIGLGSMGFLQVLIRYDGWFVSGMEGIAVLVVLIFIQKNKIKDVVGKFIIFVLPIIFGAGLWLLWNLLIYGNPLYFIFGPYSAHAQQATIENNSSLITKNNLILSVVTFWYDLISNVGFYPFLISFIGMVAIFFNKFNYSFFEKTIILFLFLTPILFNILSLYLGFSIINVPALNWNPSGEFGGQWFNVRYGILGLPMIAFFIGVIYSFRFKFIKILILIAVILQISLFWNNGVITLIDGTIGSSSFANNDISTKLRNEVSHGEKILISTSFFNAVLFKSGFNLKEFIHEGSGNLLWSNALKTPEKYVHWIVLSNGDVGEPVYENLIKKQKSKFLYLYELEYKGAHASIYKLKKRNELFVIQKNKQFFIGNKKFLIKGINSYDLAYKSDRVIDETFKKLSEIGVNAIRFWAFGDGFKDGFQVKAGIMNEKRLKKIDRIIFDAEKYNIRLIPVLVNNWDDYGGKKQYLKWTGNDVKNGDLFFSENNTKKLFKNYIDHIISRKNTITNRVYSNEPAILSWELMNEPRILSDKQNVLLEWTKEMADYIKQSDKNHLVSIGSEEEVERMNSNENKPTKLCSIKSIDICSVHLYLFHKNQANYKNFSQLNQFLKNQVKFSQKENKPILLGEFGVSKKTKPFSEKPLKIAKEITEDINRLNYNGYLIWNWNSVSDDSFGFSMHGANDGKYNIDNLKEIIDK